MNLLVMVVLLVDVVVEDVHAWKCEEQDNCKQEQEEGGGWWWGWRWPSPTPIHILLHHPLRHFIVGPGLSLMYVGHDTTRTNVRYSFQSVSSVFCGCLCVMWNAVVFRPCRIYNYSMNFITNWKTINPRLFHDWVRNHCYSERVQIIFDGTHFILPKRFESQHDTNNVVSSSQVIQLKLYLADMYRPHPSIPRRHWNYNACANMSSSLSTSSYSWDSVL